MVNGFEVCVTYRTRERGAAGIDRALDGRIEALARAAGGTWLNAGLGFGDGVTDVRNNEFGFRSLETAEEFRRRVASSGLGLDASSVVAVVDRDRTDPAATRRRYGEYLDRRISYYPDRPEMSYAEYVEAEARWEREYAVASERGDSRTVGELEQLMCV